MGFTMKSPLAFVQRRRDTQSFVALKPAALLSCCEMNVLVSIFFQNKPISSALKIPLLLDEGCEFCKKCLGHVVVCGGTLPDELDAVQIISHREAVEAPLLAVNGLEVPLVPATLVLDQRDCRAGASPSPVSVVRLEAYPSECYLQSFRAIFDE